MTSSIDIEREETTSPVFALSRPSRTSRVALPVAELGESGATSESRLATSESRLATSESKLDLRLTPKLGVGTVGPYDLALELAAGGMATVYLAVHDMKSFRVPVAVKRVHPHLAKSREFVEMFADEARIAAAINHPHVCRVFDFGKVDGSYFLAMEFLAGKPLSRVFRALTSAHLDEPRHAAIVSRIIAGLAEGLHAAHTLKDARGVPLEVVHRDVTPQNLFVLADGSVRVTDFGIAWARVRTHHTETGRIKGKLSYLAPEQLNHSAVDARSDIWSLGVVAWEMLTGRRLFHAVSEGDAVLAVLGREIPPPSRFAPKVPPELDAIVLRALSRNREERYASARELSRELEGVLGKMHANVSALDVEAWLEQLFPGHAAHNAELVSRAIEMPPLPRSATPRSAPRRAGTSPETSAALPAAVSLAEPSKGWARWRRRARTAALVVAMAAPIAFAIRHSSRAEAPTRLGVARRVLAPADLSGAANASSASEKSLANHAFLLAASLAPPSGYGRAPATPSPSDQSSAPLAAGSGSVRVDTKNGEASVLFEGHTLGTTPVTLDLPVGQHTLLLEPLHGGAPLPVNVRIDEDATSLVTVALPSAPDAPASSLAP